MHYKLGQRAALQKLGFDPQDVNPGDLGFEFDPKANKFQSTYGGFRNPGEPGSPDEIRSDLSPEYLNANRGYLQRMYQQTAERNKGFLGLPALDYRKRDQRSNALQALEALRPTP
jgi:hypothetical protein